MHNDRVGLKRRSPGRRGIGEGSNGGFILVFLLAVAVGILVFGIDIVILAGLLVLVLVLAGLSVVLILTFDFEADDVDGGDTVEIGFGDGYVQIFKGKAIAAGGNLIQNLHDPAVDGDGVRLDIQIEELAEVGQITAAVDAEGVFADLLIVLDDLVMLVPNVAYQLLQNVLHGDDTQSAAVLIQYYGQMGLIGLQVAEQIVDALALMDEQGRGNELIQSLIGETFGGEYVLGVDDAHDLVNAVLVDQQAGEAGLFKELSDLLHGGLHVEALEVNAVGEDILGLQLGEVDGVAEKVALLGVDGSLLLNLLHQHEQLLLRHFGVGLHTEDFGHQFCPQGEQGAEGDEEPDEHLHEGSREHSKALGAVLGDRLRGDLTEDQHHYGDGGGGDQGAVAIGEGLILAVYAQGDDEHGGDGGQKDVDQIVADEDGGQQAVVVLAEFEGEGSALVALLDHGLEFGLTQG